MLHGQFEVDVIVGGLSVHEYRHGGKVYVALASGDRYALRLRNNTGRRVLFIPTVDGLSAMDGKPGSYDGSGYVLDAYGVADIPGWRISQDEVAAFRAGGPDAAYATKLGHPENLGVIGCAVFEERRRPEPEYLARSLGPTRGGGMRGTTKGLGTEFGERMAHRVRTTTFERATASPAVVLVIQYDTVENLRAQGVIPAETPNPFPANPAAGFCPPPRGWQG